MKQIKIPTGLLVFVSRQVTHVLIKCPNEKLGEISEYIMFEKDEDAIAFVNSFDSNKACEWYLRNLLGKLTNNIHLTAGKHD